MYSQQPLKNFQIISKLGEGSYAQVYKVLRLSDNQVYAMKRVKMNSLKEKDRQNALNEVRILASYDDPYIIGYKETFLDEDSQVLHIIMEFATDGDLQQMIKTSIKKAVHIQESIIWKALYQMTRGLKRLHDMKIVHRDLKCANIFISEGTFKLGDLNVSKVAKKGFVYTQTGTPFYASPEVWRDEPYDMRSDIWSLGCVVYEMATHNPPFQANDMSSLFKKIQKGTFDDIPRMYSRDLQSILNLMIQVQPTKRPTCIQLLNNQLLQINVSDLIYMDKFNVENNELLKTILLPKNLKSLKEILPLSNYENDEPNRTVQNSKKPSYKGSVNQNQRYHSAASLQRAPLKQELSQQLSPLIGENRKYSAALKQELSSQFSPLLGEIRKYSAPKQDLQSQLLSPLIVDARKYSAPKLQSNGQTLSVKQRESLLAPIAQNSQIQSLKQKEQIFQSISNYHIPKQREQILPPSVIHSQVQSARTKESPIQPTNKYLLPSHKIGAINSVKYAPRLPLDSLRQLVSVKSNAIGDILPLKQYSVESPKKRLSTVQDCIPDLVQLLKNNSQRQSIITTNPLKIPIRPLLKNQITKNLSQLQLEGIKKPSPMTIQQILSQPVLNVLDHPFPSRAKVLKKKYLLKPHSAVQSLSVRAIQSNSVESMDIQQKQANGGRKIINFKSEQSKIFKKKTQAKQRPETALLSQDSNIANAKLRDRYEHYYPITSQQEVYLEKMKKHQIKNEYRIPSQYQSLRAKLDQSDNTNHSSISQQFKSPQTAYSYIT